MPIKQDLEPVRNAVEQTVKGVINNLVGSLADEDLPAAQAITSRMTTAIRHNDQEVADECKMQLNALLQVQEIRAMGVTSDGIQLFVDVALQAAFSAAVGGLQGLKAV